MTDKKKLVIVGIVAVLAIIAAVIMGAKSSSGSKETETDFHAVPPKGIGKHERE
ncbi:hypothetical protein [Fimbriimonas ginsengisoli]|uniref:Uncharacterized protein n=1 Tax=Fimbriimonas ginsengisoli Gsoil 348 TaxID=661478 RepID=A0A068NXV4_FIMGI|nr:hypothetical protein [Fimbriimonas ginsengisoli]AIE87605.1 hypothetical protein OP10G_4237 [Fimbriimonas ginsengisoli Gsoil 348]